MNGNYWRRREGSRKVGRFIRANDPLTKNVVVDDFSFMDICETSYIEADNVRRNLIRTNLHETEELETGIKQHESIDRELRPPEAIRPSLRPLDFTGDWERQKARATARRQLRMDDDDDVDFEQEMQSRQAEARKKAGSRKGGAGPEAAPAAAATEVAGVQSPTTNAPLSTGRAPAISADAGAQLNTAVGTGKLLKQDEIIESISSELNRVAASAPASHHSPLHLQRSGQAAVAPEAAARPTESAPTAPRQEAAAQDSSFVPVGADDGSTFHERENIAAEQYRSKIDVQKQYESSLKSLESEAKSRGYQDGFQYGEEKAAIEGRQIIENAAAILDKAATELSEVKRTVVKNAEQNVVEILQALAETLIKRELSLHPEALLSLVQKAMSDAVQGDEVKIHVSSKAYETIKTSGPTDIASRLVSDANVAAGEFRIESNLTIVDSNVGEIVKGLVEQASVDLFVKAS
jgi:flagellar assembly protein FliH